MTQPRVDNQSSDEEDTDVYIAFFEEGTFVVSATDEERLEIPTLVVQRCVLLRDILGQDDAFEQELPVQKTFADVKSWLHCVKRCKKAAEAAALVNQDDGTLLGAMKVSNVAQCSAIT